jgi:hypothetical protein
VKTVNGSEVRVSLIGIQISIAQARGDRFEHWAAAQVRRQVLGNLGSEPSALLGQHHREGIGHPDQGGECTGWAPVVQQRRKHIGEPIQALDEAAIAGQMRASVAPIAPGRLVERFDRALSIENATPIEGDDLFIGKAQSRIGRESLSIAAKLPG